MKPNREKQKRTKKNNDYHKPSNRQPRPLGLTLLAQQTRNQQPTNEVIHRLLQYAFSNGLQLNNKPITIQTLAIYLNTSYAIVMKAYLDYQGRLSNVMLGDENRNKGALIFLGLEKILGHQAQVSQQLQLLQASQNGSYKAYISSSVNECLKLNLDAGKAFIDIAKMLGSSNGPSNPTLIQNNFGTSNPNSAGKAIGMNEALNLLGKQGLLPISYNPTDYTHLRAEHDLDGQPEVRATLQPMVMSDGATLLVKPSSKHIDRRANEEGLDTEEHLG